MMESRCCLSTESATGPLNSGPFWPADTPDGTRKNSRIARYTLVHLVPLSAWPIMINSHSFAVTIYDRESMKSRGYKTLDTIVELNRNTCDVIFSPTTYPIFGFLAGHM